jgi:4-carboxymuconolactone decarboxylase
MPLNFRRSDSTTFGYAILLFVGRNTTPEIWCNPIFLPDEPDLPTFANLSLALSRLRILPAPLRPETFAASSIPCSLQFDSAHAQLRIEPKLRFEEALMSATPPKPSSPIEKLRPIVPKLIDLTEKVVFGDVWERPGLSKRDRSLITVAALVALYRPEQLRAHLGRALQNGVTKDELGELITHLAFYSGWPTAITAASVAKEVFEGSK